MTEHEKLVLTMTSKGFDVLTGKNLLLNNQTIKRYLRITQGLSQNKQKAISHLWGYPTVYSTWSIK